MKLIQSWLRWATLSNTCRRWFCETIRFSRGNNCEVNADDSVSSPCLDNHTCCARWCPAVLAYALHVCMWGAPSCVFSRIKGTVHVSAYSSHVCMTCRGDIQRLHVLVFYSFKVFTCCKWFDTKFCIRYLQHLEILYEMQDHNSGYKPIIKLLHVNNHNLLIGKAVTLSRNAF